MEYKNKFIACKDCGFEFEWRAVDQQFLAECVENQTPHPVTGVIIEKVIPPVRCQSCRTKRKQFFDEQKKIKN